MPFTRSRQQDCAGDACDEDDDNDGFDDNAESYVGTDPLDACPDTPDDDAWPFDMNNDTWADILDVLMYKPVIMTQCTNP